jgi:hypothetical protein
MANEARTEEPLTGRSNARVLTEMAIRNLKHGECRTDAALPSGNGRLIVSCVKARGRVRRIWTFRYRKSDLRGELIIGEHPALTLEQARRETLELLNMIRDGIDPKVAKFEARQALVREAREKAALGTFAALLDAYVAKLRARGKLSAHEVELTFNRHVKKPFPIHAKRAANAIRPEDIRDILAKMIQQGITRQTNTVRSYLQAAFTYGAHADFDPRRAANESALFKLSSNPVSMLPRIQEFETTLDRVLTDAELWHIWNGLGRIRVEIGLMLRCNILLGSQRFRQLLRVTWADYDAKTGVLRLADPKGSRLTAMQHYLPVSERVRQMLADLWALNSAGPFVFSTCGGEKSIHSTSLTSIFVELRDSWRVACGDPAAYFQGRDIRRSTETRLQSLGVSREIRAQLLSHGRTSGVQQKHYERYDYLKEKAAALALWEKHLFEVFDRSAVTAASAPCTGDHLPDVEPTQRAHDDALAEWPDFSALMS